MGNCPGKSVGGILKRDGEIYLIDRRFEPLGWACPAGHLEEGENPAEATEREFGEEIGLRVPSGKLLLDEMVEWNHCWKSEKGQGHYWRVFEMKDPGGQPVPNPEECKGGGWFTPEEIQHLVLEPVWRYFFEKLEIIKPQEKWGERDN